MGSSLEERIFPADEKLIEYLNRANKIDNYPPTVKSVTLTDREREYFKKIISDLPANLQSFIDRHLKGVFIVDDLGGSGLIDGIFSEKETSSSSLIAKCLTRKPMTGAHGRSIVYLKLAK